MFRQAVDYLGDEIVTVSLQRQSIVLRRDAVDRRERAEARGSVSMSGGDNDGPIRTVSGDEASWRVVVDDTTVVDNGHAVT